ncbi:hypothetical protein GJV52_11325 [Neisseria brasiliensis]|uniref:hypothetical protein n=1 Tax=Neisseria TaxID=482 RepID=UPI0012A98BDC|nr:MULTISPECIES: hypothetical protein [Neisseria]QGL26069.1 hypothetical protein GJV52_11325 [Neisseria brasiliensis]
MMSEDGYETLCRAYTALDTLHMLMYETESSNACFDTENIAALLSFPISGLKEVMDDVRFAHKAE